MARFSRLVGASTLRDAAVAAVDVLVGPSSVSIREHAERGAAVVLASHEVAVPPGVPEETTTVTVVANCGVTLEVAGRKDRREDLEVVAALLAAVADREHHRGEADTARRRVADSERIGRLGTYEWDIVRDVVSWSDGLFRIFGHEPGAIAPSYGRFLGLLHPDDRDRIRAVHEHSLETGEPFEMRERIVTPHGEVRTLWSDGEVVSGEDGAPLRMTGVCRDVTAHQAAMDLASRSAARFQALVDAAPDAIMVIGGDGVIASANPRCEELFGYGVSQLIGTAIEELVPAESREQYRRDRAEYLADPPPRLIDGGNDLEMRHADGSMVPVDIALASIDDEGDAIALFARDAAPRLQAERDHRTLAESELRRRQALELNDSVVQGLVTLLWQAREGQQSDVLGTAEGTLAAARRIMADLLEDLDRDTGRLVRAEAAEAAASIELHDAPPHLEPIDPGSEALTVVVADDAASLRKLLVLRLSRVSGVVVVGEASDGQQAIDLVRIHQPAVVVLDLSMPVLDGLQAARRIRVESPDTRIIVLSGYPTDVMAEEALAAGAHEYHEKSSDLEVLCGALLRRTIPQPT